MLRQIKSHIIDDWRCIFPTLLGLHEPPELRALFDRLSRIIRKAYSWNSVIKGGVLKYDFEVFIFEAGVKWDPDRMEVFERVRGAVNPDIPIVSQVSLGLVASVSLGGMRVSHVQRKAGVLVDEWLRGGSATHPQLSGAPKKREIIWGLLAQPFSRTSRCPSKQPATPRAGSLRSRRSSISDTMSSPLNRLKKLFPIRVGA